MQTKINLLFKINYAINRRTNWKIIFTSIKDASSLSSKGMMFWPVFAEAALRGLLDSWWTVLLCGESAGSVLMETICCLFSLLLFFCEAESFVEQPCGVRRLPFSSRWTRCLLLADESATNRDACFLSVKLSVAGWGWWLLSAGSSSKTSSDIRDSSSSICISSSISFLFLLWGSSWTAWETVPDWGSECPTKRSTSDQCDAADVAVGTWGASLNVTEVFGGCMLPGVSRTGRLDSDRTAEESSSSKGLQDKI